MTQEQFDRLEKFIKSIKYVDKELINDKAFNEVVCEILNIQTDVFIKEEDYIKDNTLRNFELNKNNKDINERLNPFKYTGVDGVEFNPSCEYTIC